MRPTNADVDYRQHLRDLLARATADHEREIAFYKARQQEDTQTISELAAKVDALRKRTLNEMQINALQGAIARIKEMVFDDPSQPIKNALHILEAVTFTERKP